MPKTTIEWCKNPKDLFRLTNFVQNDIDPPNGYASAAELLGHTKFFEHPILNAGASLFRKRRAGILCLCELAHGYPHNGPVDDPIYPDFGIWKKKLRVMGVFEENIFPIRSPYPKPGDEKFPISNTATETHLFVRLAKQMGWKAVYVVAHPIHILRAFTCAVSFAIRDYPELKIYAKAGYPAQSWGQAVLANQGIVTGTRLDGAMDAEYERLNTHWGNEYDHVMAEEVLEYVRRRDPISCNRENCSTPHNDHSHGEPF